MSLFFLPSTFIDPPVILDGYNEGHIVVSQSDIRVMMPQHTEDEPDGSTALLVEKVQTFGEEVKARPASDGFALHRKGGLYQHGEGRFHTSLKIRCVVLSM